jgi:hypothetical protein
LRTFVLAVEMIIFLYAILRWQYAKVCFPLPFPELVCVLALHVIAWTRHICPFSRGHGRIYPQAYHNLIAVISTMICALAIHRSKPPDTHPRNVTQSTYLQHNPRTAAAVRCPRLAACACSLQPSLGGWASCLTTCTLQSVNQTNLFQLFPHPTLLPSIVAVLFVHKLCSPSAKQCLTLTFLPQPWIYSRPVTFLEQRALYSITCSPCATTSRAITAARVC